MIVHSHEMKARAAFFSEEEILRGPLPPSERDLEVYEAVVIEGETTRSAANGFELSQTRIVQICERVAEWVASTLPETPRLSPRARLRLASHVAEGRLDHLYSLAMQAFDKSMGEQTTVRNSDQGEVPITRTCHGDIKYLSLASRLAERKYAVVLRTIKGALEIEEESGDRSQEAGARSQDTSVPPVGDCSRFSASQSPATCSPTSEQHATTNEAEAYDEDRRQRRAFLTAGTNDSSPVQRPRVKAEGMLIDEPDDDNEMALAAVLPTPRAIGNEHGKLEACPTASRPLSRRERRARQRMLEKKLKLRKAK